MEVVFWVRYKQYPPGEIHTLPVNEAEGLIKIGVCSHA